MKSLKAIILVLFVLNVVSCSTSTKIMESKELEIVVGAVVRQIACEVKLTGDEELENQIVAVWTIARNNGGVDEETIEHLSDLTRGRPTLIPLVKDLFEIINAQFENGIVVNESMLTRIEHRWSEGIAMCIYSSK